MSRKPPMTTAAPVADMNRCLYTFAEARAIGAPCRTACYALHKGGALRFVKRGQRTLIVGDSLRAYLNELPEASRVSPIVTVPPPPASAEYWVPRAPVISERRAAAARLRRPVPEWTP